MNEKCLHTLEYDKILSLLADHADCPETKKECMALRPCSDIEEITRLQTATADALNRILQNGKPGFTGTHNLQPHLKRLEIGGTLGMKELLEVRSLLEIAKRVKTYDRNMMHNDLSDSLTPLFEELEPLTPLHKEISRCILDEEEMADDASVRLASLRKSIQRMNERIHGQLARMMNDTNTRGHLQDAVVTMRDGRYCLPVKAESKNSIQGMVHDQSGSGSTLFIEPVAVMKLNNELQELLLEETKEVHRILARLSEETFLQAEPLQRDYEILFSLDFIFAKADFAKACNGMRPVFNTDGHIRIRNGRHPLLDPEKVVPIDVRLGEDYQQLIVTGPNTGGKTVSLKTVGLLTLMGQSGLHIPAGDRSELAVFEEVFADIGDEQSIEQSLSTFSSHMTNIVRILEKADSSSLVLFDELCAGTDPTEGAALAISILNRLYQYGVLTMATTHYSELKIYALSAEGVENASCEFDVATLSPTYRLLIGVPGKSNAFAISQKLGLSDSIIEDARARIGESEAGFEDLIAELDAKRRAIEKDQQQINRDRAEVNDLKKKLEQKNERIDSAKDKILRKANEEAYEIIRKAKELADQTIRNFNKYGQGQAPISQMEKERSAIREKMSEKEKKLSAKTPKETAGHKAPKNLRVGDRVKILSMNVNGTVLTLPNAKGKLFVQMGILRSQVDLNDLILLDESAASPIAQKYGMGKNSGKTKMNKSASVSPELMLLGKTTDEAIAELDKYLDDAYLAHLSSVRIVHGKGTGALRKAVHGYLRRQKHVKDYHLGEFGEGDAGVTIVTFD